MKVTLIYVGIGVAGFNNNRQSGDREGSWIAHGIASIGAQLDNVNLIDMRQLNSFDDLELNADVYGLSVSPVDYYPALKTAVVIKQRQPSAKVVVGGIHPSIFPDKYDNNYIDTVVVGEGEITFPKLIKENYFPKKIIGEKPDLDKIKFADRELFDYKREMECYFTPDQKLPAITMLAGRGCPYKCTYCQPAENAVFGKPYRIRSPENVIEELDILKDKYDFKSVIFWDDTFTFNKIWVEKLCNLWKYDVSIVACSRADIICNNEPMIKMLVDIGVDWLVVGFESGSQRLLDFIKKGTTVEQNIEAGAICKKYGIKIFGTYMYGLPTETRKDTQLTYQMIEKINPEHKSPFFFNPIPGTDIYKECDIIDDDSIARTGIYKPTINGVDYNYINKVMTWQQ